MLILLKSIYFQVLLRYCAGDTAVRLLERLGCVEAQGHAGIAGSSDKKIEQGNLLDAAIIVQQFLEAYNGICTDFFSGRYFLA